MTTDGDDEMVMIWVAGNDETWLNETKTGDETEVGKAKTETYGEYETKAVW
jgi:hypothetical protein